MEVNYNIFKNRPYLLLELKTPATPNFAPWKLNHKTYELEFRGGLYAIPLDEIHDSASILDWIFQVNTKTWATPRIIKSLLDAIRFYLHPQANYCSWEQNLRVKDPRKLVEERIKKWLILK